MWVLAVVAVLVLAGVVIYNSLVKLREQVDAAWSDVDVQLKRRYDLIPNLVETVKGYAGHEKGTLEAVIQARSRAMAAPGPVAQGLAEGELAAALRQLFALSESYPELRASENFQNLQANLAELEDHIQNARRYYNAVVRDYNTRIAQVPSNIVAGTFGFGERELFQMDENERAAPEVRFDDPAAG